MRLPRFVHKFVKVVAHPGDYVKAEINQLLYDAQEKLNEVIVQLLIFLMLTLLALLTLVFASITLALWLNQLMVSYYLGFLIVSGLYLLVFILILKNKGILKKRLETQINKFVRYEEINSEKHLVSKTQKKE